MLVIGPRRYSGACRSIGNYVAAKDDTPYLVYFLWGGEKIQESAVIAILEVEMCDATKGEGNKKKKNKERLKE